MKYLSIILLSFLTIFIYSFLLDRTPIHLNQDELGFSLNAYSIAKTGFDENDRFLPFYFWHLGVMWATPIIVYLTSIFLKFLPMTEMVIRLPSVLIATINVVLIYLLAKKIFNSERYGLLAAVLLMLTPVHFIHGRILLDVFYVVPFVIGWLLLLFLFMEKRKVWILFLTGLVLGFGIHSYHAAKVMMPLYLIFSFFLILKDVRKDKKLIHSQALLIFWLLFGFILPLVPLVPWLAQYPDTLVDQVRYTGLYETKLSPFQGLLTLFTPESIGHRLNIFINYFNPVFLFLLGDNSLIHSTSLHHPLGLFQSTIRAGVFLLPLAIFIPLGIYQALRNGFGKLTTSRTIVNKILLFGFFTAPVAAVLVGDHYRISRALVIFPFAIILATFGIKFLLSQKNKLLLISCYLLLISVPLHFAYFLYDYFGDYRIRSYSWMKYNVPGALESLITQDSQNSAKVIFLDKKIEFIDRYWQFYLIKHKREELLVKTNYFDPQTVDLENLPPNSLILYNFNDVDGLKTQIGPFIKTTNIFEPDGVSVFYVYRN